MSKYRCPACGATHKQFQNQCRLCGQSLSPDSMPTTPHQAVEYNAGKGGIKGVILIGILVCIAIVAIALVFGLVGGNQTLDSARDRVLPGSAKDGWTQLTCTSSVGDSPCVVDPGFEFTTLLPGDRTKTQSTFPGTKDGKITLWTSNVAGDILITVGYGTVTPPSATSPGSTVSVAATQNYLRDLSAQWVKSQGVDETVTPQYDETGIAGAPAVVYKSGQRGFKTQDGQDAYAQQALILKGDKLFAITVISIYKPEADDQFDRVVRSFHFGA